MNQVVPQHVGIIMDGNRRWAAAHAKLPWEGHDRGGQTAEEILFAAEKLGIKYLTLFAWSKDNWSRNPLEVNYAMDVFRKFFDQDFDKLIQHGMRIRIVGEISDFPPDLQERMKRAEHDSAQNTGLNFSLCMSYSGRSEILAAVRKIMSEQVEDKELTEEQLEGVMQSGGLPDVDLVIRSSGESRLSGFMLWKTAYSELYFTDKLWPEFTADDLSVALEWYAGRDRRYGK